ELDKTPGTNAFAGDLFVGIHTSDNPLVQLLASDQFPSSSNVYVNETGTFDLNGFDQAISSLTLQGGTVNDLELSVSPVITDGGIVKNGLGDLGLSGANTYDGPTDVTAGIIWVGSNQ